MSIQRRGFTLIEVMIAVAVLTGVVAALTRAALATVGNVGAGRRWTAMAAAARTEIARLEQRYRLGAPACGVPPAGGVVTPDGVAIDWRVAGDSAAMTATLDVRAVDHRTVLRDSLTVGFRCR